MAESNKKLTCSKCKYYKRSGNCYARSGYCMNEASKSYARRFKDDELLSDWMWIGGNTQSCELFK